MKTIIRKYGMLVGLCFCLLLVGIIKMPVNAENLDIVPIAADDVWVSGSLENGIRYYQFTIPTTGYVEFTLQSFASDGECLLYDGDLTKKYIYTGRVSGSSTNPAAKSAGVNLDAGTYCLKICDYWNDDWTGEYRLKVSFDAVNNTEVESNDTFDTAMALEKETLLYGFHSEDDSIDFYKFTLTSPKTVNFIYNFYNERHFTLWDEEFLQLKEDGWGTEGSGEYEKYLEAGTYYVKITSGYYTGAYTFKWETKQYVQQISLQKSKVVLNKGKSYKLAATVLPADANNKQIIWNSNNTDVATVDANGKIKAKRAGSATITATSTDGSDISASCFVVVKPEKVKFASLKRKSYEPRKLEINVKEIKGASGYQYVWSKKKNFKSKGKYTTYSTGIWTKKLAKNTRYYVKVRAYYSDGNTKYYGPWSNVKSIKTKK